MRGYGCNKDNTKSTSCVVFLWFVFVMLCPVLGCIINPSAALHNGALLTAPVLLLFLFPRLHVRAEMDCDAADASALERMTNTGLFAARICHAKCLNVYNHVHILFQAAEYNILIHVFYWILCFFIPSWFIALAWKCATVLSKHCTILMNEVHVVQPTCYVTK